MANIAAQITNAGLNLFASGVAGSDVPRITYCAVGTSNTAPTTGDKQLGSESTTSGARKLIGTGSAVAGTNPGEVIITAVFAATDAVNVNIQEIGFFGGNAATTSANTGVLVARALYSHTKLNTEQLTVTFDLTI